MEITIMRSKDRVTFDWQITEDGQRKFILSVSHLVDHGPQWQESGHEAVKSRWVPMLISIPMNPEFVEAIWLENYDSADQATIRTAFEELKQRDEHTYDSDVRQRLEQSDIWIRLDDMTLGEVRRLEQYQTAAA